jgi:hypothetical protein
VNTGKAVYLPGGTYKFNISIANKTVIFGDGSTQTLVKPYDDTKAAMVYTAAARTNPILKDWTYHSEVRNIGFWSNSALTGIGFSFGKTVPSDFVSGDQLANNVKFYGVFFSGFDKGVQFPFGNIGTEFFDCGWSACRYGIYSLENKFGGGGALVMHAGNKYIYGGQFDTCVVAVYIDNQTTDGFGAVVLNGPVIESCNIGLYVNSIRAGVPVQLDAVWLEGNGQAYGGNVTIDLWTGTVKGTQVVPSRNLLLDGSQYKVALDRCGIVGDVQVRGTGIQVTVDDCRVENSSGYGGGALTVDDPTTSFIHVTNPFTTGGWGQSEGMFIDGVPYQETPTMVAGTPTGDAPL